jgi:hypothetical protein
MDVGLGGRSARLGPSNTVITARGSSTAFSKASAQKPGMRTPLGAVVSLKPESSRYAAGGK